MENHSLQQLILRRGQVKAKLTRFISFVSAFINPDVTELIIRLNNAERLLEDFDAFQTTIEELDQSPEQSDEREHFENQYFAAIAQAKVLAAKNEFIEPSRAGPESLYSNNSNGNRNLIRLPTINLPRFNGEYDQWLSFYDTFNSLIHSDDSLSNIQRFHYLTSCLSGKASEVISSLEISSANYEIAWNLLKERFQNKRLIVNNHVSALFNLSAITRESHSALGELMDNASKHLRSLAALGQPIEHWDTLVIHILASKLDSATLRDWEKTKYKETLPSMEEMIQFLKDKCQLLETIHGHNLAPNHSKVSSNNQRHTRVHVATQAVRCCLCKGNHIINNCEQFLALAIPNRIEKARYLKLCINCLKTNHYVKQCKSSYCRLCNKRHHTLLHLQDVPKPHMHSKQNTNDSSLEQVSIRQEERPTNTLANFSSQPGRGQVLLATASILVIDKFNTPHTCRALLDPGSQSNFITQQLADILQLPLLNHSVKIVGVNQTVSQITKRTRVRMQSRISAFKTQLDCLVIPQITENLPIISFDSESLQLNKNIILADPLFNKVGKIDMLLGASIFWDLLTIGQIKLGKDKPTLQKTQLGWVVSGSLVIKQDSNPHKISCLSSTVSLEQQVNNFWELEEGFNKVDNFTKDEVACENHFVTTTKQLQDGNFIVNLPLIKNASCLGDSRSSALKRFQLLERKLLKNPQLKSEYSKFLKEYEDLKHMSLVTESSDTSNCCYYLPHHVVIREESLTTKLRVVFDASAKTDSGISLNDIMMNGPTIQDDLFSIILRFRKHAVVVTADIEKMFRQILVDPIQRSLQRILWRSDPSKPVECYELNTVTYGTRSAPFLAVRCLHALAYQNRITFPTAANIILKDFYVDDLLTGGETAEEVILLQEQINRILNSGGFKLRKWLSNNSEVIESLGSTVNEVDLLKLDQDETIKTLGLVWQPTIDSFKYTIKLDSQTRVTKRSMLSAIAQLFDPLGLLGPIIVVAKILLQGLWQLKLAWDESVPEQIFTKWTRFQSQLKEVNQIVIARRIICANPTLIELHGFSDASETAYGACIYIRSRIDSNQYHSRLLCAKSRVAPLKQQTIPRLELCGALLLANLMKKVIESIGINFHKVNYWCDSTIVLSWIKSPSTKWKTFVANRVSHIQTISSSDAWHHVVSEDNPADVLSRGMDPNKLKFHELWWYGPAWLSQEYETDSLRVSKFKILQTSEELPEIKNKTIVAIVAVTETNEIISRFSSMGKLLNFISYCRRFKFNTSNPNNRKIGPLTVSELIEAEKMVVKLAQGEAFSKELLELRRGEGVSSKSRLLPLHPFLDADGIIRVGGRLQNSSFKFDKKHPMLLPDKHHLTTLIVTSEHKRLLHVGPQALLAALREKYWPIFGKIVVKRVIKSCIRCFRVKPVTLETLMGNLPGSRVTPARPFLNVGIDYAGPFLIRDRKGRGFKTVKAYMALFICFATKAIHLELVSDQTTETFLAALKRFISRRGKCSNIYSDNGLNFVGANNELKQLLKFLSVNANSIQSELTKEGINWHFMPPRSPHFGGLYEAGVKSAKYHLKRIMGNALLTYEEFYTLLTQIEACLNSRPLHPLSNDPHDYNALTPSHFLIGDILTSIPEHNWLLIPENRLSRFQRQQKLLQQFWKRWSQDYVSQLQSRSKWKSVKPNTLKIDTLVLLKEDNQAPLNWKLGRVIECFPGKDGIIRTANIRTSQGAIYKRSINKLSILPIEESPVNFNH